MKEECCGTCKYHKCDENAGWYCSCEDSEFYADYTDFDDGCEEYEERE